jgi:Cys/Met metabolism PLP-dependent enzyme
VIVEETQLFKITVSFGSVSSLISLPCYMSHASIPAAVRAARGLPDDLVRISAGIEDIDDLLDGKPLKWKGQMQNLGMKSCRSVLEGGTTLLSHGRFNGEAVAPSKFDHLSGPWYAAAPEGRAAAFSSVCASAAPPPPPTQTWTRRCARRWPRWAWWPRSAWPRALHEVHWRALAKQRCSSGYGSSKRNWPPPAMARGNEAGLFLDLNSSLRSPLDQLPVCTIYSNSFCCLRLAGVLVWPSHAVSVCLGCLSGHPTPCVCLSVCLRCLPGQRRLRQGCGCLVRDRELAAMAWRDRARRSRGTSNAAGAPNLCF